MLPALMSWTAVPSQAHLWLTYGWLGLCALAPISIVLIVWAMGMHCTYRQRWRTLDILLGATLMQELPSALLVCVVASINSALVHLPRHLHTHQVLCYSLIWGSVSTRFYQFAVLTTLMVDRALILKWPYRYRFAVRHIQIRVCLVFLALAATLVGIGATLSYHFNIDSSQSEQDIHVKLFPSNGTSLFHPSSYNFSYSLNMFEVNFIYVYITFYMVLFMLSAVSFLYVECSRPRTRSFVSHNRYLPSLATLFTASSTATATSTSSSLSTSSPMPSRFSSLANLTNFQSKKGASLVGANNQAYCFANGKRNGGDNANCLYPISIVDYEGNQTSSGTYPSMATTDNSIYRLLETNGNGSRTNSLVNESKQTDQSSKVSAPQPKACSSGPFTQSDPATSLDPLNPTSRVNSFSKSQTPPKDLKFTFDEFSETFSPHSSEFDLRWSSVLGPVAFCFAFNHGPYLVSSRSSRIGCLVTGFSALCTLCWVR